jgi:hypothetical protein
MVPSTRRRLLHAAVAGIAGLAGCGRLTGGAAESSRTVSEHGGSTGPAASTDRDPQTVLLRTGSELPPIRPPDFERERDNHSRRERFSSRVTNAVLDSRSTAERLTVAPGTDRDTVSTFVAETDFSSQTLYLETNRIQECYRLRLCYVSWSSDRIETDYVRTLRPYDERCSADGSVFESRLVRLPVPLDEDDVNSFASSIGGGGQCDHGRVSRPERSSNGTGSANTSRPSGGGEQP